MEIVKGMKMLNRKGQVREVLKVSPTGSSIMAKNLKTSKVEHFRYYETPNKYFLKNSFDELGENWRYNQNTMV